MLPKTGIEAGLPGRYRVMESEANQSPCYISCDGFLRFARRSDGVHTATSSATPTTINTMPDSSRADSAC